MEDKLITLAIHTYEKAQILKTILESEGIDVYIHNVNQIQPVISAGVRVRIKESDLPHALRVLEDIKWLNENPEEENIGVNTEKKILIPIDFSDYSIKACKIGFNYAYLIGAEVVLLHVYFSTHYIPSSLSFTIYDHATIARDEESIHSIYKRAQNDIENMCATINRKIESQELPQVKYSCVLREGLPEEEIIAYAKEYHPMVIVMGTRGKMQKNMDLIGSVTAEVIEATKIPLLAVPENIPFDDLANIRHLAFATSFNESDLLAFDKFASLTSSYNADIHVFNISTSKNQWDEIRLTGFSEFLRKQYPNLKIDFTILKEGDLLDAIEEFVEKKQIDMIAFNTYRRSMIMRIFNPSIARKMLFHGNTPLLVIPSSI